MEKENVRLAKQIRFIRELEGFSQESLASYLGISQQAYQKMESGRCKICAERLSKIASFLAIDERKLVQIDKETILLPYRKEPSTSIREKLKQEVLILREEINILKKLNQRILNELES